jgi:hypothetical protein
MQRRYAVNEPQHSLPAVADCAFAENSNGKPAPGRRS